jgi:glycosyltransferase involved in cell wall biosynthesis
MQTTRHKITRVLHFCEDTDTSGLFTQLARWHDRSRFDVRFATLRPMSGSFSRALREAGVPCVSLNWRRLPSLPAAVLRLATLLRRERVDVCHTHLFYPSLVGLLAGKLAGVPALVMTRHYSDYHTRINKRWHMSLDRLCIQLAHAVIAVSQHTADHMIDVERAPAQKVHTITNGIDFTRVRLSVPDAPQRLRQTFGGDSTYLVLVAARLHPEKGYTHLFRALAALRAQLDRPVLLLVAGRGPFEDAYRREVTALGCEDQVRFLGFREDVHDLMAAADLMVLPSLAEALGLVLPEALYLGTPVVATRVGGIPEIVNDGVDGVLVPPADSEALAQAIARLLLDPGRRRQMAGAGTARIEQTFRFDRMLSAYESLYFRLHRHTGNGRCPQSVCDYPNVQRRPLPAHGG